MSGHSKWAGIKHKKAVIDAKRGKAFSKLAKEITVAAKIGGGDPDGNPRLRLAIDKAKEVNMPNDNIKRAVQKGTGELEGSTYDEISYEAYGPAGVAIYIETLTDNRTRTVSEIRHLLSKHGGNLGESGSVAWMFERSGSIRVSKAKTTEDALMELALEVGARDIKNDPEDDAFEVLTEPDELDKVRKALVAAGVETSAAELAMIPKNTISLDEKAATQVLKLMDLIEDHDDVQNVFSNFDISAEIMQKVAG